MIKWFTATLVMLALTAHASIACAELKLVEAKGQSLFSHDDAVKNAQRAALEQAVGVFIHTETEVENYQLKKDRIFSHTEGYIKRYEILKAEKVGQQYQTIISAAVSMDEIKDDLIAMKILLENLERPTMVVVIDQSESGPVGNAGAIAETEITRLLTDKGFEIVDQGQAKKADAQDKARQALSGNDAAAEQLGLRFNSQYVVVGRAVVNDAGEAYPGSGLHSMQANLMLKVIQTQTGAVLGSVSKNAVSAHTSALTGGAKAVQKAARIAVETYLVTAITHSFQGYVTGGSTIEINVSGLQTFREYQQVADMLETLPQVVSSKKEGWNKQGQLASINIKFKGTSQDLAQVIDGRQLGGKYLEVTDVGSERVHFLLK